MYKFEFWKGNKVFFSQLNKIIFRPVMKKIFVEKALKISFHHIDQLYELAFQGLPFFVFR